jgi:ArsR family transcriptional regulator
VNRLTILELLIKGETCGCTLIDKLPISQPTMSYHLNILTESGLTTSYKDGTWKKHHVDINKIDELIKFLT